jgi:uncharacterized Zn finger protein (UPF0148 family)
MSDDEQSAEAKVLPFRRPAVELGRSPLSLQLLAPGSSLTGHWCSRCHGIWYGLKLEVECPICGNRHG